MLHIGLCLAADLLKVRMPEEVQAAIKADGPVGRLAHQIYQGLPAAGHASPSLLKRAMFRLRMCGGLFAAPTYLLRLSFSPTEEDWQAGGKISLGRFRDAVLRPIRLARKHSRSGKD